MNGEAIKDWFLSISNYSNQPNNWYKSLTIYLQPPSPSLQSIPLTTTPITLPTTNTIINNNSSNNNNKNGVEKVDPLCWIFFTRGWIHATAGCFFFYFFFFKIIYYY
jgi:hypothetical protein